ncbi:hypothetical protein [Pseudomonas sp. D(2018)]|uniref:hypothetical protein n=1 Tax=Pseudomonas sp. D(2018) TaxID=2502238 RepID=UPI0010F982A7|nr:hypothetical protein [Pseudomonas sp. D(2018)]
MTLTTAKKLRLLEALLQPYRGHMVTGYLVDARIQCGCIVGIAYNAWSYQNGQRIDPTEIVAAVECDGRWLIDTYDHDCFVVVNFHPQGGRRSLHQMIALFQSAKLVPLPRRCRLQ